MKLSRYLARLGYGTRREVELLLRTGQIHLADGTRPENGDLAGFVHDLVRVNGEPLDPPPGSVIMLHKPAGVVCSTRDSNPVVYDLLPQRFRSRSPIIVPVGRLDRDTTGLLLLTDDGDLLHRLTSPKWHVPRQYLATLAQPIRDDAQELFASGTLTLSGEATPLAPATLALHSPTSASVSITEGRYHQVRRMFAAIGNHVLALHRERFGPLALGELPERAWRMLTTSELGALEEATRAARFSASPPPAP